VITLKRVLITLLAAAILLIALAATAFADPPGPGNSRNGKCVGKPSERIGGCFH
jgi:hypothetical protein